MLSRVAESVYWIGRYIERAENIARFIDVNYNLTLGESNRGENHWQPLVQTIGCQDEFAARYAMATPANVLRFLAFDEENPNSIISCVARARENARTIREVISSVVWEQLNKFFFMVRSEAQFRAAMEQPQDFCERVRLASHLIVGATDATLTHNDAWHFSRMGRLIERADMTSRIVDVQFSSLLPQSDASDSVRDIVRWSALLKSASALEMYRRQYGKIVPQSVVRFLILDRCFPRSMHFCVMRAQESLQFVTGDAPGIYRNHAELLLGRLRSQMDYADVEDIFAQGLHAYVEAFQLSLYEIGNSIHENFFALRRLKKPDEETIAV